MTRPCTMPTISSVEFVTSHVYLSLIDIVLSDGEEPAGLLAVAIISKMARPNFCYVDVSYCVRHPFAFVLGTDHMRENGFDLFDSVSEASNIDPLGVWSQVSLNHREVVNCHNGFSSDAAKIGMQIKKPTVLAERSGGPMEETGFAIFGSERLSGSAQLRVPSADLQSARDIETK